MDETLKRLLTAEGEAARLVEDARQERENTIQKAREKAYKAESGYDKLKAEIRSSHLDKSHSRAKQAIEDLGRRYDLRSRELHLAAKQHEESAIQSTLDIVNGTKRA